MRALSHSGKQTIAQMETRERTATGIQSLKIKYNDVFGYYIEISKANLGLVPERYERKQTLVGAERFTVPRYDVTLGGEFALLLHVCGDRITRFFIIEDLSRSPVLEAV